MRFFDTESVGLVGPLVLIQWKDVGGEPIIYEPWFEPVSKTLALLEEMCNYEICGWNLTHDWFHVNKFYNCLYLYREAFGEQLDIENFVAIEKQNYREWCLKPKSALDLLLYARTGPLQKLMVPKSEKADIVLKRVPRVAVKYIIERLPVPDSIFFHHRENKGWQVQEVDDDLFVNLVLRFGPSMGLKPVYKYLTGKPTIDYPVDDLFKEIQWKPYGGDWPFHIKNHINHWHSNTRARQYATNDVIYLEDLWNFWGNPSSGDNNSVLACSVGAVRWRGFPVNSDKVKHEINNQQMVANLIPFRNQSRRCKAYILEGKGPIDHIRVPNTKKETLVAYGSDRALQILNARQADKRLQVLRKFKACKRFHPNFNIIGAKTNRMSGSGKFNAQGIPRGEKNREVVEIFEEGFIGGGGDFDSFEVTLADAVYNDNNLHSALVSGKSIHGLLGAKLYGKTYEEVMATKKDAININAGGTNMYNPAKNSVFGLLYGAQAQKIAQTAGISEEQAEYGYTEFIKDYPQVGAKRAEVSALFQSVKQPGGKGSKVIWGDPADYIETQLGFRRYYTLENEIIKGLFELAENLCVPVEGTIVRRDREQTIENAVRSALYATVFVMQQRNMRSANNHLIQGYGADICKQLQVNLWNLQPVGVHEWKIVLMNVHDEILSMYRPELVPSIDRVVADTLESFRKKVPLLSMTWKHNLHSWADK